MIATTDAKSLMMQQTAATTTATTTTETTATTTTTTAAKHDWIQPEAVAADIFFSVRFFQLQQQQQFQGDRLQVVSFLSSIEKPVPNRFFRQLDFFS